MSKVRQTQPSAAMDPARIMSCSWLPPHPCTKSRPGTFVSGVRTVPPILCPPTAISISRLCAAMFQPCDFRDRPDFGIIAAKEDYGVGRNSVGPAIDFGRGRPDPGQRRIAFQRFYGEDLGRGGAAQPPGLLQHAASSAPAAVRPECDIVVSAGVEKSRETGTCCLVVAPGMCDGDTLPIGKRQG